MFCQRSGVFSSSFWVAIFKQIELIEMMRNINDICRHFKEIKIKSFFGRSTVKSVEIN